MLTRVSIVSLAVVFAFAILVAFSSGWVRFFALLLTGLSLLASIAAVGGVGAYQRYQEGSLIMAAAIGIAVPCAWLLVAYVVVGLQAESTTTYEVGRNALIAALLLGAGITIAALLDREQGTESSGL